MLNVYGIKMEYLNSERDLTIAMNTTNYLIEKLEKYRNSNKNFEIFLNYTILQTSSQFRETLENPDVLMKHIFYVEDLFWAYTYIGPNTYKLIGDGLLDSLSEILKTCFLTNKQIVKIETNELFPERPVLWRLHFGIKAENFPSDVLVTVALIPKGKVYWLQDELKDYRSEE
jgi:hypothetical protein